MIDGGEFSKNIGRRDTPVISVKAPPPPGEMQLIFGFYSAWPQTQGALMVASRAGGATNRLKSPKVGIGKRRDSAKLHSPAERGSPPQCADVS